MKYRIGYLDEQDQQRINFLSAFEKEFEVVVIDNLDKIQTVSDLRLYVKELELDALVVDFMLSATGEIQYNGNEVIEEFSTNQKYFPVIIITSHEIDALAKTENVFIVNNKDILKSNRQQDLDGLKKRLNLAISNYYKVVADIENKAKKLEQKQRDGSLTNIEEEQLIKLHIELKAIDPEANPLPANLLQTDIVKQLSELVKNTREILEGGK